MPDRLYLSDSFVTSFQAAVTGIREALRRQGQQIWQISLNRTAFYPGGGGQPHDQGAITATAPSGAVLCAPITAVTEEADEIWHTTAKPLAEGASINGEIDWTRRFDHMQQHSGQHLLSAVFLRTVGAPTVSFHLGEEVSTIDLATANLSPSHLAEVEDIANRMIGEDRLLSVRSVSRQDAEALLQANVLRKLPPREGAIRLVEIQDLDLNACGGTHVRSTGQIGGLLIRGIERKKEGFRIEFVCGLRAVRASRKDLATLHNAGAVLSASRDQVADAVELLSSKNKVLAKELQRIREEMADDCAARILEGISVKHGPHLIRRSFTNRDIAYMKLLASRSTALHSQICVIFTLLGAERAQVLVASSADLVLDCGAVLREGCVVFGARGGGSATIAQGEIAGAQVESLASLLEENLRKACGLPSQGPQGEHQKEMI